MIITISGMPGTGKTTIGKTVASRLGMKFYSIGDLRGKMAQEKGITIDQLNALGEQDASTDFDADKYQKELGEKEDHFVIEGRLSWHFIPQSFKIFLTCDPTESARRVWTAQRDEATKDDRKDEQPYATIEEARQGLDARIASDVARYKKYYDLDYQDLNHYDLVLDTTQSPKPEFMAEKILEELKKRKLT